jgi:hypothetical protein
LTVDAQLTDVLLNEKYSRILTDPDERLVPTSLRVRIFVKIQHLSAKMDDIDTIKMMTTTQPVLPSTSLALHHAKEVTGTASAYLLLLVFVKQPITGDGWKKQVMLEIE